MTFTFAVGILGMVNISWPTAARQHDIFFILSLSREIHRYDASIKYDVFPSSSTNMSSTFRLLLYPIQTGT